MPHPVVTKLTGIYILYHEVFTQTSSHVSGNLFYLFRPPLERVITVGIISQSAMRYVPKSHINHQYIPIKVLTLRYGPY